MMGEHLLELDPEEDIVDAFSCFDEGDKGVVDVKEMRKFLGELGDRMEDWEVSSSHSGDRQVSDTPPTMTTGSQDGCRLMYRLIDCSVDLLRIDRGSSIMLNSQKSCESRTGTKRGMISLTHR
jgi:hypothetical protein